jgi:YtoQ family protein
MELNVYLAGEIHNPWREQLRKQAQELTLPIRFTGPMEDHDRSDAIGEKILGKQLSKVARDEAASSINNLRTHILMKKSDLVIAYFGEQYKQWNSAMDAATAITLQKPVILIRDEKLHHPLKELANKAQVVVETPEQALQALAYLFE